MAEYCEIVETLVSATSSCPLTETVAVQIDVVAVTDLVELGEYRLVVSSAVATSPVFLEPYARLFSTVSATSTAIPTVQITVLRTDRVNVTSATVAVYDELEVSTATATSSAAPDLPVLLISSATASSTATPSAIRNLTLVDAAAATSSVVTGLYELAVSVAAATSPIIGTRQANELAVSTATATSPVSPSNIVDLLLLVSTASTSSSLTVQTDHNPLLEAAALAQSWVSYKNPDQVAWVMNTETTAVSWYNNYGFDSIAQTPMGALAVGPEGLYLLGGTTDEGETIDAELVTGMTDFGTGRTLRVDGVYLGYTSNGRVSMSFETLDSGHAPDTYLLEERLASAPRTSRIQPGMGRWGRYWRMTFRNVNGAKFEVHDSTVDIAVSQRRM
jgi:hypothetical protein